jgi:flagellin
MTGLSATSIGSPLSAGVTGTAAVAPLTAAGKLTINGTDVNLALGATGTDIAKAINDAGISGVTASVDASNKLTIKSANADLVLAGDASVLTDTSLTAATTTAANTLVPAGTLSVNGQDVPMLATEDVSDILTKISAVAGIATATINNGRVEVTSDNGKDVVLSNKTSGALSALGLTAGTSQAKLGSDTSINLNGVEVKFKKGDTTDSIVSSINSASTGVTASKNTDGTLALFANKDIVVADGSAGTGLTALGLTAVKGTKAATTLETTVSDLSILSAATSQQAVQALDGALQQIDSQRSQLGAVQNRFASTVANLQSISQNSTAAKGRVEDADFASEAAELTKQQTLQQASTAILSQANQLPSAVLKLLQ